MFSLPGPPGSAPGSFRGSLVTALKLAEPPNTFERPLGDPLGDPPNLKNLCFRIGFKGFCLLRLFPLGAPSGSLPASPGTPVGAPGGAGRLQTGLPWSSEVGRPLPELLFLALGSASGRLLEGFFFEAKMSKHLRRPAAALEPRKV